MAKPEVTMVVAALTQRGAQDDGGQLCGEQILQWFPPFKNDFNRLKIDYSYLKKNLRPFGTLQNGGPKGGAWSHVLAIVFQFRDVVAGWSQVRNLMRRSFVQTPQLVTTVVSYALSGTSSCISSSSIYIFGLCNNVVLVID
jgi:hypothetical protein